VARQHTSQALPTYGGSLFVEPPLPGNTINIADVTNFPNGDSIASEWTDGATMFVPSVLGGPGISQGWSLLSVSIQGYLALISWDNIFAPTSTYQSFGKLGKIVAGLILDEPLQQSSGVFFSATAPFTEAMVPLPSDGTLVDTLFDPDVDAMPPQMVQGQIGENVFTVNGIVMLPVSVTIQPPNPIDIIAATPPTLGIWMTPSLLGVNNLTQSTAQFIGLTLMNGSFTVDYDDGL
jgi:hypothetical protein